MFTELVEHDRDRILFIFYFFCFLLQLFRSIILKDDFEVSLSYESKHLMPPGVASPIFAQYTVSGLANTTERCELVLYVTFADLSICNF